VTPQLLLAQDGQIAWLQYKGKGSFLQSSDLKSNLLEAAQSSKQVFLDLGLCEGMDSTFMGILVSVAKSLTDDVQLELIYVNNSLQELMEGLGLQYFLTIKNDAGRAIDIEASLKPKLEPVETGAVINQDNIYTAHQTLSDMNPENANKFKDVLDAFDDE